MGWFIRFIDSSIGKKLIMALTGFFLAVYLVIHLVANLFLLKDDGGEAFEAYASFMSSSNNIPVRIIEIVLFAAFIYHIVNGLRLWWLNKKARSVGYLVVNASANSSFYSRFMVQSGIIVLIFLVIHLRTFFFAHRFGHPDETMYQSAINAFQDPWYAAFYVLAMILLAFHLVHGVQSAFQTLGVSHNKYTPLLKGAGITFAILICAGFAIIPLYILLIIGGGN
ncbi:MAG: succinate dehydrogenase cytochrome b subunit [Ignavibacteriaceae bacterium]